MSYEDKFWDRVLDNSAIIIDGECYHTAPENETGYFRGFGGRKFKIQFLDNNEIIETTNLWHQGKVPEEYNRKDNAKFI